MEKETVGLDFEAEYFRLKGIEAENEELKETIINMSKTMFRNNEQLINIINQISKALNKKL